jgi:uncharacterized protein YkwD
MKTLILILTFLSCTTPDIKSYNDELPPYQNTNKDWEVLESINSHRVSNGLRPLQMSNYLSAECNKHNQTMISLNQLSHSGFSERGERIKIKFPTSKVGECLSYGYQIPLQGWLNSQPHKQMIESNDYNFIGVAYKDGYCTVILAK